MSEITIKVIAADYQEVNKIDNIIIVNEKNPITDDVKALVKKSIITKLTELDVHQKRSVDNIESDGVYICRGKERNGEKINLWEKFPPLNNSKRPVADSISEDGEIDPYFRIGGIVGALSYDADIKIKDKEVKAHIELHIKSRFDAENNYFFVERLLLSGLYDIDTHNLDVHSSEDTLFDFLLVDMLANVIKSVSHKGHYRTYQKFEKNDDRLKGAIDISRHIRLNAGIDNGRVAYSYSENTIDNRLNRLLLLAYKRLKLKYPELVEKKLDGDIIIRDYIKVLNYKIDMSTLNIKQLIADNRRPIAHPYYTEYERLRQICFRILRDEGLSIFGDDDNSVKGFLFYIPDLWENFLEAEMIKRLGNLIEIKAQEEKRYIQKPDPRKKYMLTARPDFVIALKNDVKIILDAKFRPDWKEALLNKGNLSDFCKADINKCLRDMVVFNAKGTGIIFPVKNNSDMDGIASIKRKISDESDKNFYIVPVGIPTKDKADDWNKEFDNVLDEVFGKQGKLMEAI